MEEGVVNLRRQSSQNGRPQKESAENFAGYARLLQAGEQLPTGMGDEKNQDQRQEQP